MEKLRCALMMSKRCAPLRTQRVTGVVCLEGSLSRHRWVSDDCLPLIMRPGELRAILGSCWLLVALVSMLSPERVSWTQSI